MARKYSEFYKGGQKKKRNYAIVPIVIILFLITLTVVLFYSAQKYAVITAEGVTVELPIFGGSEVIVSSSGLSAGSLDDDEIEYADAELIVEQPDYSEYDATAGKNVKSVRGIFIPYSEINAESVEKYANRLSTGNSLLLEVKTQQGYMQWYSSSPVAYTYGLNMNSQESTETLKKIVQSCKDRDIYMVAKISVCRDDILATHASNVILRDQFGGGLYDEYGYYIDPYNDILRAYTVDIINELWDMGFDEVVLDDLVHPVIENKSDENAISVMYTKSMSADPSAVGAVCGFAVNISQQLEDRPSGKFVSAYVNSPTSLVRADKQNGQDGRFFMKVFDRVYYNTDMYAYTYNVQDIQPGVEIGNYHDRFVPVVINYLPDNTSWILVDYDEDK